MAFRLANMLTSSSTYLMRKGISTGDYMSDPTNILKKSNAYCI